MGGDVISYTSDFAEDYDDLIRLLLEHGVDEENARTGHRIRALPPCSFVLDLKFGTLPLPGNRRVFPKTAAAELAWFLSGSRDVSWLRGYAPIWDKFVEADGSTVEAAYGYRWRQHFGRDQIELAVEALQRNPSDRRVWVSAWDPATDGLGASGQKNVPCPVGFSLSVLDGRLNSALAIRSSDVFVGLPYDVMGHSLLMAALARDVGVSPGHLHVTLAHPHLYHVHVEAARRGSEVYDGFALGFREPPLPDRWGTADIARDPDGYVAEVARLAHRACQPSYNPKPEVVP